MTTMYQKNTKNACRSQRFIGGEVSAWFSTIRPSAYASGLITFGLASLFHVLVIWALASGLAARLTDKIPQDIKADIVKEAPPKQPKTPPPPPPDLVKPPPPFIPPPDIVIANDAPTNTISN